SPPSVSLFPTDPSHALEPSALCSSVCFEFLVFHCLALDAPSLSPPPDFGVPSPIVQSPGGPSHAPAAPFLDPPADFGVPPPIAQFPAGHCHAPDAPGPKRCAFQRDPPPTSESAADFPPPLHSPSVRFPGVFSLRVLQPPGGLYRRFAGTQLSAAALSNTSVIVAVNR